MADYIPKPYPIFRVWITNFNTVVQANKVAWGLSTEECTALETAVIAYLLKDDLANGAEATAAIRLERKKANSALIDQTRHFVNKFINVNDTVGAPQRLELGLHIYDGTRTPTPPPSAQAEADVRFPGIHLIELYIKKIAVGTPDTSKIDYGVRIYYGIMPQGGASVEAATGSKRELMKQPQSGNELPHSVFTRKKKYRFDFGEEDRGKWVYFCLRYENSKGETGPWGPIMNMIIP
jgi:hypothetical protein